METRVGSGIEAYGRVLSTIARSLRLRAPAGTGGLVWNRPVGVVVEDAAGVRHLRIPDRTRQIQWGLLAAGLAIALTMRLVGRRRRPVRSFLLSPRRGERVRVRGLGRPERRALSWR